MFSTSAFALDDYQAKVQELIDKSQYPAAAKILGEVSARTSDNNIRQQILIQQGDIYYYYLEDYNKALDLYKDAYDAAPKSEEAADLYTAEGLSIWINFRTMIWPSKSLSLY